MTGRRIGAVGTLVALALAAAPGISGASAASPAAPGLKPVGIQQGWGWFHMRIAPGASATGEVSVTNSGNQPAIFPVYVADAWTSRTSGVAYGPATTSSKGAAAWVDLPVRSVTLGPHRNRTLRFTVSVPAGTAPGQYLAGLAAQSPRPATSSGSRTSGDALGFRVISRTVVAVEVTVPGPAPAGVHVGRPRVSVDPSAQLVKLPLANTGARLESPALTAVFRRCSGGPEVASLHRKLTAFVPHSAISFGWYLAHPLPAGCYRGRVSLSVPGTSATSSWSGRVRIAAAQVPRPMPIPYHSSPGGLSPLDLVLLAGFSAGAGAAAVFVFMRRRQRLTA